MVDKGLMFLYVEPEKKIAVILGHILRGISIKHVDDGWRMVITVTDSKGNHLVAFIQMATPYDCWWYLNEHLTKTSAPLTWRTDRYAKY